MKRHFTLFFLILNFHLFSQSNFDRYYTFNTWTSASCVLEVPNYGYYAICTDDSLTYDSLSSLFSDHNSGLVLQTNFNGDSLAYFQIGNSDTAFASQFGDNSFDKFRDGLIVNDSNLLVIGESQSYNAQDLYDCDIWLVKLNPQLDTLWTRVFSIQDSAILLTGSNITKTNRDEIVVAGGQRSFTNSYFQSHITVFDSTGTLKFHSRLLPQISSFLYGAVQTSDLGFLATGIRINSVDNWSPLILKTDSIGNVEWNYVLPFSGDLHLAYNIIRAIDGNYVYVWANVFQFGGTKVWKYHATKIKEQGIEMWTKDYFYSYDAFINIVEMSNGNLAMYGWHTDILSNTRSAFVLMADANGDSLWSRLYNGNPIGKVLGYAGNPTSDGGFILGGETYCCNQNPLIGNTSSIWLAKTDSLGLILSSKNYIEFTNDKVKMGMPYPNPSSNSISLEILIPASFKNDDSRLLLFDISGKQLMDINVENGFNLKTIDISLFPNGTYLLALSINGYNSGQKLFIKN